MAKVESVAVCKRKAHQLGQGAAGFRDFTEAACTGGMLEGRGKREKVVRYVV